MSPPPLDDTIEVEFGPQFLSTGMGLRLHPATETDIGAMLIFSYFASPVKVLTIPPCRYQVEAIGDLNVRSLPYNEIKSRMQALVTYPVIITFVRHPMWFTLRFPRRPLHIQIQERIPIGRLEIVDYVQPYTTTDLIPSRFWGTPFIRSVNGLDLAQSTDNAGVLAAIQSAALPIELGIDIVQTELSISAQQYLVKHYCSSATSPPHTLAYKDIPSCSSSTLSKKQPTSTRQSTRVPKQPIKHVAAPVVVLDDSDASEAEIVPRPPSRLELTSEGFELDKVVSTPFGIGLIVALPTTTTTSSTTTSSLPIKRSMNKATVPSNYSYKVQLSYGDGYFHATSLTLVDDKVQYTYYKKRSKGWVVLTYGDTSRLCGHRLLNDSVIEFYLSYLMDTLPTPAVERTYMCSSFLFGQYLVTKKQALRKVALSNVEQAYASVARWTKSIDVFNTKYLVVPVNEEGHWSVAIVCNLYRFANTSVCRCAVVDPHGRAAHPSSPSALKPAKRPAPAARTLLPKRLKAPPLTQRGVKVVVMESVPSNEFDDVANGPVSVPPPSSWQTQGGESGGSCALTKGQATPSGGSTLNPTLCENEPAGVVTSDERPVSVQFKRPSEPCAKSEQQQHQSGASKSPQEPVGPQRCNTCGLVQDIDQDTNHRPCIVFLDSLKAHRTLRIAKFLREYLQMEWRARKAPTCGPMSITVANLPMISPREIPRQSNYTDCGVFVLHYVEKFLSNPPLMSTALIATKGGESQGIMTKNWFHPRVIQLKRVAIRHLIETLAKQSHYTAQPTRQVSPTHHEES